MHGTLEGYVKGDSLTNDELLTSDVDILVPAALENVITTQNAARVRAKIICEGANGPTTPGADTVLEENGVFEGSDTVTGLADMAVLRGRRGRCSHGNTRPVSSGTP